MSSPSKGLQMTTGGMYGACLDALLQIKQMQQPSAAASECAVPMLLGLHPMFYPATFGSTACVLIIIVSVGGYLQQCWHEEVYCGICFFLPCVCRELV